MKKIIILFLMAIILASCSNRNNDSQYDDALTKVGKNHKAFDVNLNADTTKLKLFLTLKVENSQIVPTPISIDLIPGPLAYNPVQGTFKITTRDSLRNEITSFFIENPLVIRSCDDTNKPIISTLNEGVIHIQIPFTSNLIFIEMEDEANKNLRNVEINLSRSLQGYKHIK